MNNYRVRDATDQLFAYKVQIFQQAIEQIMPSSISKQIVSVPHHSTTYSKQITLAGKTQNKSTLIKVFTL
jgi:hypothetical protein